MTFLFLAIVLANASAPSLDMPTFVHCPEELVVEVERVLTVEHARAQDVSVECAADIVVIRRTGGEPRTLTLDETSDASRGRLIALLVLNLSTNDQLPSKRTPAEIPPPIGSYGQIPTEAAKQTVDPAPLRTVWTSVGALTVAQGKNGIRLGFSGGYDPISPGFLGVEFSFARGLTSRFDLGLSTQLQFVFLSASANVFANGRFRFIDHPRVKLGGELGIGVGGGAAGILDSDDYVIPLFAAVRPALNLAFVVNDNLALDLGLLLNVSVPLLSSSFHIFAPGGRIGLAYQSKKSVGFFINAVVQPVVNFESAFKPASSPFVLLRSVVAVLSLGPQWQF